MSLPESWATSPLANIAHVEMGQSPDSRFYNDSGDGMAFFQGKAEFGKLHPKVRKWCTQPTKVAQPGDILLSVRAPVGPTNIADVECCVGRGLAAIRAHSPIRQDYLHGFFRFIEPWLSQQGTGSTFTAVSGGFLREIEIAIAPLAEQKRIADKLEAVLGRVDACRARLDRVPDLLKRFRQSVLAAATSGQLTEDWREKNDSIQPNTAQLEVAELIEARQKASSAKVKFKEPASADMSQWKLEVPPSWSVESVSAFAECLDSIRVPVKREKRANTKGLYPYYGANGEVDRVDEYLFDDELVLVTEDETFYGREKPIAYRSSGKCWVNNHAHVLRAADETSSDYLCYALMYYEIIPWLTGTTGRAKLTQGVLNALPIAVPPKIEMVEIVRRVKALFAMADRIEARLSAARAQVERLTPATLHKAFRGDLVPQDPNDEPASKLLERLSKTIKKK